MVNRGIGDDTVIHPRGFHTQFKVPGFFLVNFQVSRRYSFIPVQGAGFVTPGDIGINQEVIRCLIACRELGQKSIERTFDTVGVSAGGSTVEIILVITELGADAEFFRKVELQ